MNNLLPFQLSLIIIIFLSVVLMNVVKKNTALTMLYLVQSVALTILLGTNAFIEKSLGLFLVTIVMFVVKVIIAPMMFMKVIRRSHLNISTSSYLNVPLTLAMLIGLCLFAQSEVFSPFSFITSAIPQLRLLLFGSILISFFLIINRKGIVSAIIGVLSLENCIYTVGLLLGVAQLPSLELGILFDVLFWMAIATVFIHIIYKHYGSFEVTELTHLKT